MAFSNDPITVLWDRSVRWAALEDEAALLSENESSADIAGLLQEAVHLLGEPEPSPVYVWDDSKRKLVKKEGSSSIDSLPCELTPDSLRSCASEDPSQKLKRLIAYGHKKTDGQLAGELAYTIKQERKFLDEIYAILRNNEITSAMDGRLLRGYKSLDSHFWKLKARFDAIQKAIAEGDVSSAMLLYVSGPDSESARAVAIDLNRALDDARVLNLVRLAGASLTVGAVSAAGGVAVFEGAILLGVSENFAAALFAPVGFVFAGRAWNRNLWDNSLSAGQNASQWLGDYSSAVIAFSVVGRTAGAIGGGASYLKQSAVFAAYTPHEVLFRQVVQNGAIDEDLFIHETASMDAIIGQQATLFAMTATGYPLERAGNLFGGAAKSARRLRGSAQEFLRERYLPDSTPVGEFGGMFVRYAKRDREFIPRFLDEIVGVGPVPIAERSSFRAAVTKNGENILIVEALFGDRSLGRAEVSVNDGRAVFSREASFSHVDLPREGTITGSEVVRIFTGWLDALQISRPPGERVPEPETTPVAAARETDSGRLITVERAARMHPLSNESDLPPVPVRLPLGLARRLLGFHRTHEGLDRALQMSLGIERKMIPAGMDVEFGNLLNRTLVYLFPIIQPTERLERALREHIALIWEARGEGFRVNLDEANFAQAIIRVNAWEMYKGDMIDDLARLGGAIVNGRRKIGDAAFVQAIANFARADVGAARQKAAGFKTHAGPKWERLYGEHRNGDARCTALSPSEYHRLWVLRRAVAAAKARGLELPAELNGVLADLKNALDAEPVNWSVGRN